MWWWDSSPWTGRICTNDWSSCKMVIKYKEGIKWFFVVVFLMEIYNKPLYMPPCHTLYLEAQVLTSLNSLQWESICWSGFWEALFVTSLDFPFLHVILPPRQHWVVCRLLLTVSCVTVDWRPFTWGWSGTLRTPWLLPSFWRLIRGWSASSTQVICCKHFKITHTTDLSKHARHYLQKLLLI